MNRTIITLSLILMASPAGALEREPGGPLGRDVGDHQTSGERGGNGGRDGTVSGRDYGARRDFGTRGYVGREHSGHAGDRD
jgi:hypothetical protein